MKKRKSMINYYLEDCFEGMKKIKDKTIDCVLTDPPYGINYKSGWSESPRPEGRGFLVGFIH